MPTRSHARASRQLDRLILTQATEAQFAHRAQGQISRWQKYGGKSSASCYAEYHA